MPFPRRRRLSTTAREALYESEALKAAAAGLGEFPICNIPWCQQPIKPGQAWDESHYPRPHALGGKITGCAHKRCNRDHGNQVVTPIVAKAKRQFRRDRDILRSRKPLPGGRDDPRKRSMAGPVVDRRTGERWGRPRPGAGE
jgi:hypothetical protein